MRGHAFKNWEKSKIHVRGQYDGCGPDFEKKPVVNSLHFLGRRALFSAQMRFKWTHCTVQFLHSASSFSIMIDVYFPFKHKIFGDFKILH